MRAPGRLAPVLREVVYGGSDGIVTTFAIAAGFAGADAAGASGIGAAAVLLFGLANLLADGTSMGLGAFLSSRSAAAVGQARRRVARARPAPEAAEATARALALRGLAPRDARAMAEILGRAPELEAEFAAGALGPVPAADTDRPVRAGLVTFGSFVTFGAAPLLPFAILPPGAAFGWSLGAAAAAQTVLALLRWQATGEGLPRCLTETLGVGAICGAVAFAVGLLFR